MTNITISVGERPTRHCGDCTLCCKLMPMRSDPKEAVERWPEMARQMVRLGMITGEQLANMTEEFDKPAGARCPHQRTHKGCAIYDRRPFSCRFWNCRWLVNDDTADLKRPDRSGYVLDLMPDYVTMLDNQTGERRDIEVVQIWCDPKRPDAWRDPALLAYLERRGREGKAAIIRYSSAEAFTLFPPAVASDGQWHEIRDGMKLPERSREAYLAMLQGDDDDDAAEQESSASR